jgi:SAM-dependent methyltransferase
MMSPSRFQFDYIILRDLRRAIAEHAPSIRGRVLDYGCGQKPYAPLFRHVTSYVGADFRTNPVADIYLTENGLLPPDVGEFDAVLSFQVLEHVTDPIAYLSECRRAVDISGGPLLISTHGVWEYHPGPRDLYRWTHEGLQETLNRSGLYTHSIAPITTGTATVLQIIACRINRSTLPARAKTLSYVTINALATAVASRSSPGRALHDFPMCYLCIGYPA